MVLLRTLSICTGVLVSAAIAPSFMSAASAKSQQLFVTAPPADVVIRHISFDDLNLASPTGERTLFRRVEYGVNEMCADGSGGNDGSLTYKTYMVRCSSGAWYQARPQMANAVQRAREIATIGTSSIAATALTITLPK